MSDFDRISESVELHAADLVALRASDPDGEISEHRVARGFDVAECRVILRDGTRMGSTRHDTREARPEGMP